MWCFYLPANINVIINICGSIKNTIPRSRVASIFPKWVGKDSPRNDLSRKIEGDSVRRVKTQMYAFKKGILAVKMCTESLRNFWISDFTIQAFDIMCDILKEISSSDQIFKPPSR